MFTIFATTAAILGSMSQPRKVEAPTVEAKPEYLQRVDEHVAALFTPERIEEYKRLGLM